LLLLLVAVKDYIDTLWGMLWSMLLIFAFFTFVNERETNDLRGQVQLASAMCVPKGTSIASQQWLFNAHVHSNSSELYTSTSLQQMVHAAQRQQTAALQEIRTRAADLALSPDQLQQLSSAAAEVTAAAELFAARMASIVAPLPPPEPQQPADTLKWVRQAYARAGMAWMYHSQVLQAPLQQMTSAFSASVQQLVSAAAAEKGLPAEEAAEITAAVESSTQDLLSRTSTILQPQQRQQPQQQPQQEGWQWLQLAYAASGRSSIYDSMVVESPLTAAVQQCQSSMHAVIAAAADRALSPAVTGSISSLIDSTLTHLLPGVTAVLSPKAPQLPALEAAITDAEPAAIAAANSTEPTPEPQQQSPLPPLSMLPLCSIWIVEDTTASAAAAAPSCPVASCGEGLPPMGFDMLGLLRSDASKAYTAVSLWAEQANLHWAEQANWQVRASLMLILAAGPLSCLHLSRQLDVHDHLVQCFNEGFLCAGLAACPSMLNAHKFISVSLLQGAAAVIVGVGASVVKMTSLLSRTVSANSPSGCLIWTQQRPCNLSFSTATCCMTSVAE